ncbi:MAG: hypothetical protein ACT4OU_02200 [Hyphomicrobium sp.]
MIWFVLASIAVAFGAAFGGVAGALRFRGVRSAARLSWGLVIFCLAGAAVAYWAYVQQRHGAWPPDHFLSSVLGNIIVVGGLLVSIGGALGAVAAYVALLRGR